MSLSSIFKVIMDSFIKTEATSPITIPLQELSRIWLTRVTPAAIVTTAVTEANNQPVPTPTESPEDGVDKYLPKSVFESFWNEYIEPNTILFKEDGSLLPVSDLINLLSTEGVCPSIVVNEKIFNSKTTADLAKISLQNHSIHVAENLLGLMHGCMKESEYRACIPTAIIAALGHDIGKLPSYITSPTYSKHDHPHISVDVLKQLFGKYNVRSERLDLAIEAIKMHHEGHVYGELESGNRYINWLQYADHKSREEELAGLRHQDVQDGAKWLGTDELLKRLLPLINKVETSGKHNEFYAFSFENTVYARLDTLYDIVMSMYSEAGSFVDIVFEYENTGVVELARKQIMKRLHEEKKLQRGMDVNISRYGKWYTITSSSTGSARYQLVPIPVEKFGYLPSELELEKRKQGWLRTITAVRGSGKKQ
ncbi:MAG: HD domain-containing protein [Syntrophaceae bacterium]